MPSAVVGAWPEDTARAAEVLADLGTPLPDFLTEEALGHVRALNEMAQRRGQSLAQMALAWALRDDRGTTVLLGASSVGQLEQNVGALGNLDFSADELAAIDGHAVDSGIDLWEGPRTGA